VVSNSNLSVPMNKMYCY